MNQDYHFYSRRGLLVLLRGLAVSGGICLTEHPKRLIQLEGTLNVRDLGGYPAARGKRTRWERFVRADNLDRLTPEGCQHLLDYGVRVVVDLRMGWEVAGYPSKIAGFLAINYHHRPLYENELEESLTGCASQAESNQKVLGLSQLYIKRIFESLASADPTETILFHCASGKDRTGLIAGLLLDLAEVSPDLIAEDYALSAGYLEPRISLWREAAIARGQDMAQFEQEVGSDPQTMLDTISSLHSDYGGSASYLIKTCGIRREDVVRLRESLLE